MTFRKSGICLSGGGSKGAFQAGVLNYLLDHPSLYPTGFDYGSGCSVGAINLGGLAQVPPGSSQLSASVQFVLECWESLSRTEEVWRKRFPPYIAGLWNPSIGDNSPLRKQLETWIDLDKVNSGTPVTVAAWDLLSGKPQYFKLQEAKTKEELISFFLASSSFPLAFPPEEVRGTYCTDGGIFEIAPAKLLIKEGCEKLLVVTCHDPSHVTPRPKSDFKSVMGVGARCLEGMGDEILRGDLEKIRLWNYLVEARHPKAVNKKRIAVDVVVPVASLGDSLDFSPAETKKRIKVGYESAKAYFENK